MATEIWQGIQFTKVNELSQQSIRQFMTEVENLDRWYRYTEVVASVSLPSISELV
jgi:hypothetical protein